MKTQSIIGLSVLLIIILAVNPRAVNNIYETVLGRIFMIGLVIFFSMHNTTLGLLVALAIIAALNEFGSFTEGMENETTEAPTTIGEDNIDTRGFKMVLTKSAVEDAKKKISDLKNDIAEGTIGVDKEDIKLAIMPKNSKAIPVEQNMTSSDEVLASASGMLNSNSKLEGYSNCAPV
jgi:anti-sigma28 factor (negative regulator of flagellin synthesis)